MSRLLWIVLLGSAQVYCQNTTTESSVSTVAPTYDELVATRLTEIDSTRTALSATIATELPVLQSIRSATATLTNTLPNAIINDRLSESLTRLDAISAILTGTTEAFCFQNYASVKSNILTQARQTYSTCTTSQTTLTNQLINDVSRNITTLNSLASTAKTKVTACGNNALYRVNMQLFNYCMTTATAAYDAQLVSLTAGVASLQTLRTTNVNTIATCVANTVARAETILQAFNDFVSSCIVTSTLSINFTSIITNVQQTSNTTYTSQITSNTTTAANLTTAKTSAQTNLDDATTSVSAALAAKALTYASVKATLDTEYASVATAFAAAGNAFSANVFARTCVSNIRSALQTNLVKQATQVASCVQNVRSSTLSTDLAGLRTSYNQQLATDALIAVQCLGQVDYLFIDQGVTQCREYAESDETSSLTFNSYQTLTLKQSADMVTSAVNQCNLLGRTAVVRQYLKDKLSFETCILKNVRQVYVITL